MYTIGELSQQTDVSRETIRYYERIELLPPPQRSTNGYRQYSKEDVERLQFIRLSRTLDFSIDEIREILALRERQEAPCQYVMDVMDARIDEIESRIQDLEKLKSEIQYLHKVGHKLPEDVQMKTCVCHLIVSNENYSE